MLDPLQIALGYRRWLVTQAREEASSNCPRMRGVLDDRPMFFLELTDNWPNERRFALMRACIKHRERIHLSREALTSEEAALFERFSQPTWSRWAEMSTRVANGEFQLDRKALRSAVRTRLGSLLGRDYAKGCLRFVSHLRDVTVYTDVTIGGRGLAQLGYEQMVVAGRVDEHVGLVAESMILRSASFMEILGSITQWKYLTNEDVPRAVDLLANLCAEFIDAIPGMV